MKQITKRKTKKPTPITYEKLQEKIHAGDWRDEVVAAWRSGGQLAVAQELASKELSNYVLVWICGELQEVGADLDLLSDMVQDFEDQEE